MISQNLSAEYSLLLVGFGLFSLFAFAGTLALIVVKKTRVFGIVLLGFGMLSVVAFGFFILLQPVEMARKTARDQHEQTMVRENRDQHEQTMNREEGIPGTELEVAPSATAGVMYTKRPPLDTFHFSRLVLVLVGAVFILSCLIFLFYNQKTRPYAYGLVGIVGCAVFLIFMNKREPDAKHAVKHRVEVQESMQQNMLHVAIRNANQTLQEKAQELKDKGKTARIRKRKKSLPEKNLPEKIPPGSPPARSMSAARIGTCSPPAQTAAPTLCFMSTTPF